MLGTSTSRAMAGHRRWGQERATTGLKEGGKEFFGWHEEGGRVYQETGLARETTRSS